MTEIRDASADVPFVTKKKLIKLTKNPKWRLKFHYFDEFSRFHQFEMLICMKFLAIVII